MRHSNAKRKTYSDVAPVQSIPKNNNKNSMSLLQIKPLTFTQARAFKSFDNGDHICLTGCPGTGKTFVALYLALRAVLDDKWFERVIVLKSAKATNDLGFLPGSLEEKLAVYEESYIENTNKMFEKEDAYSMLKQRGIIEFSSTSYLRGMQFDDAVVILDEFQNASALECHTVATRLGENCRLICMGDSFQTDFLKHDPSGFDAFVKILKKLDEVSVIDFGPNDIVRSGFVKKYMQAIIG